MRKFYSLLVVVAALTITTSAVANTLVAPGDTVFATSILNNAGEQGPWTDAGAGFDWDQDENSAPAQKNVWKAGTELELTINCKPADTVYVKFGILSLSTWAWIGELPIVNTAIPTMFTEDNNFVAQVSVTLAADLEDTDDMKVTVADEKAEYFIQAVTASGQGNPNYANTKVTIGEVVGVSETAMNVVNVYPNPVAQGEMVTIEAEGTIEVYTVTGSKVLTSENSTFSTVDLRAGVYLVKAGNSSVSRLVVK